MTLEELFEAYTKLPDEDRTKFLEKTIAWLNKKVEERKALENVNKPK